MVVSSFKGAWNLDNDAKKADWDLQEEEVAYY